MLAKIQMRRGTSAEWAAAAPVILSAGEPGWDSTLKGMKVGDGSTEWAALPWIDAKNRPDINADTLDGVHLADIRLGQNILHNWDFRNPINQRGVSGAISAGTYFYDRWIRNSGTVTVAAGYLTLASGAVIEQRIEGLYLAGETVTVSVMVGSTIYNGTGVFPISAGTAAVTLTGFGTATLGYNSGYMFVRFSADAERNVTSVKVELGTASTLHLDPPMDRAAELPKCQMFYEQTGSGLYYLAYTPGYVVVSSMFKAEKRIASPTVSLLTTGLSLTDGLDSFTASPSTAVLFEATKSGIRQLIISGFSGLTLGSIYYPKTLGDYIAVSADL